MEAEIEKILFGGMQKAEFVENIWGCKSHYAKECFLPESIFSIEELTEYMRESGVVRSGHTSVGKERRDEFSVFTTSFDVSNLKALNKLHVAQNIYDIKACFDDGRGVLAHRLERVLPINHPLRKYYRYLLTSTGCIQDEIIIAAFLTPPYSKTFDWHVDSDHVFTLQLEGEKLWDIKEADGRVSSYKLIPGDTLYVPSDLPHRVVSTEKTSLSISFVVIPKTYAQIFTNALLRKLENDLELAHKIPLPLDWHLLQNELLVDAKVFEIFKKYGLSKDDFYEAVREENFEDSISYLDPSWAPNFRYSDREINSETWLKKPSSKPIKLFTNANETEMQLLMDGRPSLRLSKKVAEAINFIQEVESSFQCKSLPDIYQDNSKIVICEKLLRVGILDFAKATKSTG